MSKLKTIIIKIFGSTSNALRCGFFCVLFFCFISAYTLIKELQSSIFASMVGARYTAFARNVSVVVLIPYTFLYSFLVDRIQRHVMLVGHVIAFLIVGLIFVILFAHPEIGLANTKHDMFRITAWMFYCYVDAFVPLIGMFWALLSSMNTKEDANKSYAFIVASSKIGGMVASSYAYYNITFGINKLGFSHVTAHLSIIIFSMLLLAISIPFVLKSSKLFALTEEISHKTSTSIIEGLRLLCKSNYTRKIFGTVFFYEIVSQIINFQRVLIADNASSNISEMSIILYQQIFYTHLIGFSISMIFTNTLLRFLGVRFCIMALPIISGLLVAFYMITLSPKAISIAYIGMNSLGYAMAAPSRECLFLVCSKDILFKSKSWIDSLGISLSKTTGQQCNVIMSFLSHASANVMVHSIFFVSYIFWIASCFFAGKQYQEACNKKILIK